MPPRMLPPASIGTPPPSATTWGRLRRPLDGLPGWLISARPVVLLRKLTAVHALPMAVFGVCAPA